MRENTMVSAVDKSVGDVDVEEPSFSKDA